MGAKSWLHSSIRVSDMARKSVVSMPSLGSSIVALLGFVARFLSASAGPTNACARQPSLPHNKARRLE